MYSGRSLRNSHANWERKKNDWRVVQFSKMKQQKFLLTIPFWNVCLCFSDFLLLHLNCLRYPSRLGTELQSCGGVDAKCFRIWSRGVSSPRRASWPTTSNTFRYPITLAQMTIDPASSSSSSNIDPNATPAQLLASLRSIRNSVIGSRTRKSNLASKGLLPYFSALLLYPIPAQSHNDLAEEAKGKGRKSWNTEDSLEIRGLAATILGSVAHGE